MATVYTPVQVMGIKEALRQWNPALNITTSAEGDSIIATAKHIDVDGDDLRKLANIIGDDGNITFGRSGASFRMIIW